MVLRKITFAVEARVGDHVMSRPGAPLDAITFDEDDFEYVTTEKLAEVALGLMTLKQQSGADSPRREQFVLSTPQGDGIDVPFHRTQLIIGDELTWSSIKRQHTHVFIYVTANQKLLASVDVKEAKRMPSQRSPLASLKLDLEDNKKAEAKKTKKGKKAKTARGGGGASPREDEDDEDPTRLSSNRYQRHSWGSRPYGASNAAAGSDDDDDGHVSWEMTSHDDGSRGRGDRNHDDDYGGYNQDRGRRGGVGRRDDDDDDEEEDDDGDDDDYDARAEQASAATAAAAGKRARSSTARTSGGGAEQAESSSSAQHPWSRALAKCDGDVEKAMDHSDLAPTGNGKTVRGKFADLRAAVGRLSGTAPAPGGGAPAAAPSRSFEDPLLAVPNPRCFFCGFCDKFFLLSTLGDVKGMKKHMADSHNPSLAKVLDPPEKDPTTFATMVDPTDQPFRLSAAQCRARYQLAPTVAVVVASKKHKYVTDADEYIDEL